MCNFEKVFSSPQAESLFDLGNESLLSKFIEKDGYKNYIESKISSLLVSSEKTSAEKLQEVESFLIVVGIAALHTFIQINYTGPAVKFDLLKLIVSSNESLDTVAFKKSALESLSSDGEPAHLITSAPQFLILALSVLSTLSKRESSIFNAISKWWYIRALIIQQSILNSSGASIFDQVFAAFADSSVKELVSESSEFQKRYYLEKARAELIFDLDHKADDSLKIAQQACELQYVLTGFNAKRTKYQRKDTPQLVLLAQSNDYGDEDSFSSKSAPDSLPLNSDLFLEKPSYTPITEAEKNDEFYKRSIPDSLKSIDPNSQPSLKNIDSVLLLLRAKHHQLSSPYNDPLVQEELMAFVSRIILSPVSSVNWSVFSRSLWERSVLESNSAKTVERGTLQMQSLVDELGHSATTFISKAQDADLNNLPIRFQYIHQLMPLPSWSMDSLLAEKYMSLGALRTAIDLYERLQMWGEVALCYAAVGQEKEGEAIIRKHLKDHPEDARSWSILGDITTNPEYWEKSWEVGRYPASKRSLGRYYYAPPASAKTEKNLELAISHLYDSLKINPLNFGAWFLYGCVGLESEQYELAAEAFTRCVSLDEDDDKSWSNLSTSLLRLGKKPEAFSALKRALRAATEKKNWRIWSNYVTVGIDLRDWSEVLRGVKEVIKIKKDKEGENSIDLAVLETLASILVSTDFNAESLTHFQKSCTELYSVILPSIITSSSRMWKLVAKVELWRKRPWAALEAFEKGFRIYTHSPLIETEEASWKDAVDFCEDLVDAYTNFGELEGKYGDGSVVCKDWKFKARSAVRSLMGKGKRFWEDGESWDKLVQIKEDLSNA
ncbi:TPR-like protein [Nadsonia fulvescens var. elongata DSM 6958]|uniref:TPR-like protein n=1 Tax=Nadsonia fulvescens var. elongata DSM 6958 TaxID=857566 RepID=A0A1E3PMT9_9ASCO|nr:TPR-like protein [Nadsonia fulvescens var. elongata DSM 6958]